MQVGTVTFHAAVTDAVGTIVPPGFGGPSEVLSKAPFLFSRCGRSGSAGDSDRREVRAPHPQEAPSDQCTAHLGNYPRGCRRCSKCPPRIVGHPARTSLEYMPADRDIRSDAGTLYAA